MKRTFRVLFFFHFFFLLICVCIPWVWLGWRWCGCVLMYCSLFRNFTFCFYWFLFYFGLPILYIFVLLVFSFRCLFQCLSVCLFISFVFPFSIYWLFMLCDCTLCIGECPSNSPFLKNNGAEAPKGQRPIVIKEWRNTRTFSNLKSTHCTLLILLIINLVAKQSLCIVSKVQREQ